MGFCSRKGSNAVLLRGDAMLVVLFFDFKNNHRIIGIAYDVIPDSKFTFLRRHKDFDFSKKVSSMAISVDVVFGLFLTLLS